MRFKLKKAFAADNGDCLKWVKNDLFQDSCWLPLIIN